MSLFKAYDIRGVYGEDLTDEIAYKFGRAFVSFLKCKVVVVGRDMRDTSPKIEEKLIQGLTDQGADVVRIGMATTPMLYFATAKFGYDAGINVTASHNPAKYNGFKLVRKDAVPISGDTGIYEMRDLVNEGKFEDVEKKGNVTERAGVLDEYIKNALSSVDVSNLKKFKIVVDTANGMGGLVIPDLLGKVPCEFEHMFPELDGTFPNHEANPLKAETLRWLQAEVKNKNANLGVAFDGDADRIGFVDEKGEIVPMDLFTALIAMELLKHNKGAKILHDLRSSKAVSETITSNGGQAIETRVGHSFIKAHMREEKAAFAGEVSGHYYLQSNYYIESPYIVMLLLLKLMTETNKPLSELMKPLKKYFNTGEVNFEVKDKEAAMEKVKQAFPDAKRVYNLDGLSMIFDDWWLNLRPSNTESLLRLNLEANTAEKRDEMKEKIIGILES
ncbi:phosphomannomutase/phosphoglucomutase [Candidatus Woesearchaeota archaeon]|nr:phosphomannomutase/phosphoglucomutase [Candidatus Woesearchaeota archaeon]|tara:strand:+ start:5278 stop:6612 length:1335 start_codon:yes stop_codon:yes gene_type:complete